MFIIRSYLLLRALILFRVRNCTTSFGTARTRTSHPWRHLRRPMWCTFRWDTLCGAPSGETPYGVNLQVRRPMWWTFRWDTLWGEPSGETPYVVHLQVHKQISESVSTSQGISFLSVWRIWDIWFESGSYFVVWLSDGIGWKFYFSFGWRL